MSTLIAQANASFSPAATSAVEPAIPIPSLTPPTAPSFTLQLPDWQTVELTNTKALELHVTDPSGGGLTWGIAVPAAASVVGVILTVWILARTTRKQIAAARESAKEQIQNARDTAEAQIRSAQETTEKQLAAARQQALEDAKSAREHAAEDRQHRILTELIESYAHISLTVSEVISALPRKSSMEALQSLQVLNEFNAVTNKLKVWVDRSALEIITAIQNKTMQHALRAQAKARDCMQSVERQRKFEIALSEAKEASSQAVERFMVEVRRVHSKNEESDTSVHEAEIQRHSKFTAKATIDLEEERLRHISLTLEFGEWNIRQQKGYEDLQAEAISAARRLLGQDPLLDYMVNSFREIAATAEATYREVMSGFHRDQSA